MTKQTIEELIPEIEESGGWYFYYHDSMSDEAKPGAPDVGNYHPYVQSFHNYPESGTQTFEHSSNESDGRLEFNKNYWVKNGRIFVPSGETRRGKVNVPKQEIVKVPRDDFLGKLGFSKNVTQNKVVVEDRDVPVYRTMPYFSNPSLGTGYIKFGMWPFTMAINRGLSPDVYLGMLLPTAMVKDNEDVPPTKENLYSKVVGLIRENPYNAAIIISLLKERGKGKYTKADGAVDIDEYQKGIEEIKNQCCTSKYSRLEYPICSEAYCIRPGLPAVECAICNHFYYPEDKTIKKREVEDVIATEIVRREREILFAGVLKIIFENILDINGDGVIDGKDDLNKDNKIDDKDRELFKKQKENKK